MSIRPIDMQVLVPRTQQIAHQKQAENQKSSLDQSFASNYMNKSVKKDSQSVKETNQNEKSNKRFDAKEKGNQSYQQNKNKTKKRKINQQPKKIKEYHKIDIKI
ncbi:MAG: hypothetical protein ACLFMO_01075 [Eubacteriales bacterium]